jgi:hypothetical protein
MALSLVVRADEPLIGFIVDKACATGKVAKQADPQAAAANENRGCILMTSCLQSGLGIYVNGTFYSFDEKGNSLAKAALEKSKKDKGAKFKVTGKVTADKKVAVTGIEEVTE